MQCLKIWPNSWYLKQGTTAFLIYFMQWCCAPSMLIPSLSNLSQRVSFQVNQTIGRGWWLYEEWNLLTWTFSWVFSFNTLVMSSVVILLFIFFIMILYSVYILLQLFFIFFCFEGIAIQPLGGRYVKYFSIFLVASLVIFPLISGEFFGLKFNCHLS